MTIREMDNLKIGGFRETDSFKEMFGSTGGAPAYYGSSLGSNQYITQKLQMADISKGVAKTHRKNNTG